MHQSTALQKVHRNSRLLMIDGWSRLILGLVTGYA